MITFPVLLDCQHTAKPDTPHLRGICSECNYKLEEWLIELLRVHEGLSAARGPIRVGPVDGDDVVTWDDLPTMKPRRRSVTPLKTGYES